MHTTVDTTSTPTSSRSRHVDTHDYKETFFSRDYAKFEFTKVASSSAHTDSKFSLYERKNVFNKKQVHPFDYQAIKYESEQSTYQSGISKYPKSEKRAKRGGKLVKMGKFVDEIFTLRISGEAIRREITFDYIRPLNRKNVPGAGDFQRLAVSSLPNKESEIPWSEVLQEPGPSRYTTAHLVDTITLRRPDFVHATAGNQLIFIVERDIVTHWHVFHLGSLAYLTTSETAGLGGSFDFTCSGMLNDRHILFWKRGAGRIAIIHTDDNHYFSESSVTVYELGLAIYWVAYDKTFIYFGGQEAEQIRPEGSTMPMPAPRGALFAIYCTRIDAHFTHRVIRRVWISRSPSVNTSRKHSPEMNFSIKQPARPMEIWRELCNCVDSMNSFTENIQLGPPSSQPCSIHHAHVKCSTGNISTLNKWHSLLVWFDGSKVRMAKPHFALVQGKYPDKGQLQLQHYDTRTAQLSSVETMEYEGPTSFWSSKRPFSEVNQEELNAEFRPYKSLIVRVRSTLDNVWLYDMEKRIVRRLIIRSPWLPRCPLYAACHSLTDDGKLFVYCSTERGGPLVCRRSLSRPVDRPSLDHAVVVPLSGVLRLEELASFRLLSFIHRYYRHEMLKAGYTNTAQLLQFFNRKPYRK